jgi:hypothetical protein
MTADSLASGDGNHGEWGSSQQAEHEQPSPVERPAPMAAARLTGSFRSLQSQKVGPSTAIPPSAVPTSNGRHPITAVERSPPPYCSKELQRGLGAWLDQQWTGQLRTHGAELE